MVEEVKMSESINLDNVLMQQSNGPKATMPEARPVAELLVVLNEFNKYELYTGTGDGVQPIVADGLGTSSVSFDVPQENASSFRGTFVYFDNDTNTWHPAYAVANTSLNKYYTAQGIAVAIDSTSMQVTTSGKLTIPFQLKDYTGTPVTAGTYYYLCQDSSNAGMIQPEVPASGIKQVVCQIMSVDDSQTTLLLFNDIRQIKENSSSGLELCDTDIVIRDDKKIFEQLKQMKHSTFDRSKFEVVGSPTITDEGVASGFSSAKYLNTGYILNPEGDWSVRVKFRTGKSMVNQHIVSAFPNQYSGLVIQLRMSSSTNTVIRMTIGNGSDNYVFQPTYYNITGMVNTDFDVEVNYLSGVYSFIVNGVTVSTLTSSDKIVSTGEIVIGKSPQWNEPFLGSVDLKYFSITVDGKEVFSGNKTGIDVINDVEIPYTLSKTGSKIVDVAYRDRVIDLYEQEGQAGYYTIDETNQNFTLPMGEIYGMIEKKADKATVEESLAIKADVTAPSIQAPYLKHTYVSGTSGYNIWSNGYCEQWGAGATRNTTITFLKTFVNTNYVLLSIGFGIHDIGEQVVTKTTKNFTTRSNQRDSWTHSWKACGYLAEGEY